MPLTPQEKNFCDHFDYESRDLSKGQLLPAHEWMKAHGLGELEIFDILIARGRERTTAIAEDPEQPFAVAWKTANEARRRNQELAKEAEDAKRTGHTPLGEN